MLGLGTMPFLTLMRCRFPNPVKSVRGHRQESKIGIHCGFACKCLHVLSVMFPVIRSLTFIHVPKDYLYGTLLKMGVGKCKQIKDSVLALQKKYPHYRTYLTGHSLGGAL